jgi:hypothetical protein
MLDYERLYYIEREKLLAISTAFQAELNRLASYVATLKAAVTPDTGPAVDAADTAALDAALTAAGAPEPAPATTTPPTT